MSRSRASSPPFGRRCSGSAGTRDATSESIGGGRPVTPNGRASKRRISMSVAKGEQHLANAGLALKPRISTSGKNRPLTISSPTVHPATAGTDHTQSSRLPRHRDQRCDDSEGRTGRVMRHGLTLRDAVRPGRARIWRQLWSGRSRSTPFPGAGPRPNIPAPEKPDDDRNRRSWGRLVKIIQAVTPATCVEAALARENIHQRHPVTPLMVLASTEARL